MAHTIRQKEKLIARVRRLKGQIEGVERALEAEATCAEVLRQLASVRGAMNGLTAEVMEDHLREHLGNNDLSAGERAAEVDDVVKILRSYMK